MSLLFWTMILATIVLWLFFFLLGFSTVGIARGFATKIDEAAGATGELKPLRLSPLSIVISILVLGAITTGIALLYAPLYGFTNAALGTGAMLFTSYTGYFIGFYLANWIALQKGKRIAKMNEQAAGSRQQAGEGQESGEKE